jgi:hypothetical protein
MSNVRGPSESNKYKNTSGTDDVSEVDPTTQDGAQTGSSAPSSVDGLPVPSYSAASGDDAMMALAVLEIKMVHNDRDMADKEQQAAQKAQDEAHDRKIEEMHKQADDTFMSGLVGGVFEGLSAGAQAASAVDGFASAQDGAAADAAKASGNSALANQLTTSASQHNLNAGLNKAFGEGYSAAGKFASSIYDAKKLGDKSDEESADKDLDHAKSANDKATSRAKQDQDDIQTTINALRGITQSKEAIEQGTVIRA